MLPDFLIPLTELTPGEDPYYVRAWDVPAWLFLYQIPADVLPGAKCYTDQDDAGKLASVNAWEAWGDSLVDRVTYDWPALPGGALGPARDRVLLTYFQTIGWDDQSPAVTPAVIPLPANLAAHRARVASILEPRRWVPGPNVQEILTLMSTRTRVDAGRLIGRPISEWIWLYRLHAQEVMLRKGRGRQVTTPDIDAIGTTA